MASPLHRPHARSETALERFRARVLLMPGPQNLWLWLHCAIILRLLFPCLSRDAGCSKKCWSTGSTGEVQLQILPQWNLPALCARASDLKSAKAACERPRGFAGFIARRRKACLGCDHCNHFKMAGAVPHPPVAANAFRMRAFRSGKGCAKTSWAKVACPCAPDVSRAVRHRRGFGIWVIAACLS